MHVPPCVPAPALLLQVRPARGWLTAGRRAAPAGGYCEGAKVSWKGVYPKGYVTRIEAAHDDRLRTLRFYMNNGASVGVGPSDG